MAIYSNPVFNIIDEILSIQEENFHYDIIYEITDTMDGVGAPQNVIGLWHGKEFSAPRDKVNIKEILITKTGFWVFLAGGALHILDYIPAVPTRGITAVCYTGLGTQNMSNITVPVPFNRTNFITFNMITYRLHAQKPTEVNYYYPVNGTFSLTPAKTYLNTALETAYWQVGAGPDLTNYVAAVLAAYAGFLPAGAVLYGYIQRFNYHIRGVFL